MVIGVRCVALISTPKYDSTCANDMPSVVAMVVSDSEMYDWKPSGIRSATSRHASTSLVSQEHVDSWRVQERVSVFRNDPLHTPSNKAKQSWAEQSRADRSTVFSDLIVHHKTRLEFWPPHYRGDEYWQHDPPPSNEF